jgi:hypothetical protein
LLHYECTGALAADGDPTDLGLSIASLAFLAAIAL